MRQEKGLRVLSLFDGMSCGQIALRDLGFPIEVYYASEIDKFAIQQTQLNFPDTVQLGDVRNIDVDKLCENGEIDLLIGGSPCTNLSFAGKRAGLATKENIEILTLGQYLDLKEADFEFEGQSYLFWEFMRILTALRRRNPNIKFLLENVEMGKKWERVFSDAIGIHGVHINSVLVSAQNRKRIYWSNIRVREEGLFGDRYTDIPQPADRGILLRDILEKEVDERYFLSDKMLTWLQRYSEKRNQKMKLIGDEDKTRCVTATAEWKINLTSNFVCVAMRGRNPENPSSRNEGVKTVQMLEPAEEGKTNCLTTVAKDNLIAYGLPDDQFCLNKKRNELGRQIRKEYEAGIIKARRSDLVDYAPREDNKTGAITTVQSDNLLCIPEATKKGYTEIRKGEAFDMTQPNSKTRRGRKMSEKCNCLTTESQGNYLLFEGAEPNKHLQKNLTDVDSKANAFLATSHKGAWANGMTIVRVDGNESSSQPNRVYSDQGKSPNVGSTHFSNTINVANGYRIRRITPTECARLQTIPEWYKWEYVKKYIDINLCEPNVELTVAKDILQTKRPDYVICTILGSSEQVQLMKDQKLINQKNAQWTVAIDNVPHISDYASCTIKGLRGMEQQTLSHFSLNMKRYVLYVEKLSTEEMEVQKDYAQNIIAVLKFTEIQVRLIKGTKNEKIILEFVDICQRKEECQRIERFMKITLAENCKDMNVFIISILIKQIIELKTCIFSNLKMNTKKLMLSFQLSPLNLSSVALLNLRMGIIASTSETQQYRMLGNGWTVEVIKHIFSFMKLEDTV